jgi:hypothetical protein
MSEVTVFKFPTFMAFAKQHAINMGVKQLATLVISPKSQDDDEFEAKDLLLNRDILSGPIQFQHLPNNQHKTAVNEYLDRNELCKNEKFEAVGLFNRVLIMGEFSAKLNTISKIAYLEELSQFIHVLLKKHLKPEAFVRVQICQAMSDNSKKFAIRCVPEELKASIHAPLFQSVVRANGYAVDFHSSPKYYDCARIFLHELMNTAKDMKHLQKLLEHYKKSPDEFKKILMQRESKKKEKTLDLTITFDEMMADMDSLEFYEPPTVTKLIKK